MQKYADRRGIALQEAGQEEEGDTVRGQMAVAGEQAQDQIDQSNLRIPFDKGETISGISLGGGLTLGKLGSKIQSFVTTGKKVISSVDSASTRASSIARASGGDSVADSIDAARGVGRRIATRVGDGATSLADASKGVTQASRSGLETAVSNASNINNDLVRLAPDSTRIAGESSSLTNNISRSVTGSNNILNAPVTTDTTLPGGSGESRGLFGRMFGKKPTPQEELPDALQEIRDKAAGQTFTEADMRNMASNDKLTSLNPDLAAPDRAVAGAGRSIEDVSKSFASQSADDLIAGGTDVGRVARGITPATEITADASKVSRSTRLLGGMSGDSTLARATGTTSDNPFSFRNQGVTEGDLGRPAPTKESINDRFGDLSPEDQNTAMNKTRTLDTDDYQGQSDILDEIEKGPSKTSKFGDVMQSQQEENVAPLEGTSITQPRAQPPAQPDALDPNAGASGGQASVSNKGRNGGTSEADAQSKATSRQADANLDAQVDKDQTNLDADFGGDKGGDSKFMDEMEGGGEGGEAADALSFGDKFLKYGGMVAEGVGVLGDLAGVGYGVYELSQIPEEQKELDKEQKDLTTAENSAATPGKVTYGDIAGATLNTAPTGEGGTFQHF